MPFNVAIAPKLFAQIIGYRNNMNADRKDLWPTLYIQKSIQWKVIKPKVTKVSSSSDNRNPRKISFKTKIKRVYAKHRQKLLKTIPILGLLYLLVLFLGDGEGEPGIATNQLSTEQLWEALEGLVSSFKFGDPQTIIITVVTAIVIWTGYKYWLLQLRVFRRKQQITERLVFAFIAFVFINNHIKVNSPLGRFVDWAIFLIFFYLSSSRDMARAQLYRLNKYA